MTESFVWSDEICPKSPRGMHRPDAFSSACVYCGCEVRSSFERPFRPHGILEQLAADGLVSVSPLREDILVEPRAITGNGPQGNPHGIGRGELRPDDKSRVVLTPEDKARAVFYAEYLPNHGLRHEAADA